MVLKFPAYYKALTIDKKISYCRNRMKGLRENPQGRLFLCMSNYQHDMYTDLEKTLDKLLKYQSLSPEEKRQLDFEKDIEEDKLNYYDEDNDY